MKVLPGKMYWHIRNKETSCLLLRRKSFKKHLESMTEKGINEGELFASY